MKIFYGTPQYVCGAQASQASDGITALQPFRVPMAEFESLPKSDRYRKSWI